MDKLKEKHDYLQCILHSRIKLSP